MGIQLSHHFLRESLYLILIEFLSQEKLLSNKNILPNMVNWILCVTFPCTKCNLRLYNLGSFNFFCCFRLRISNNLLFSVFFFLTNCVLYCVSFWCPGCSQLVISQPWSYDVNIGPSSRRPSSSSCWSPSFGTRASIDTVGLVIPTLAFRFNLRCYIFFQSHSPHT